MVRVAFSDKFKIIYSKIKDNFLKQKILKQIEKIKLNPSVGKPMKNVRKGTRELYITPFRLAYAYNLDEEKVIILDLYHKKKQ